MVKNKGGCKTKKQGRKFVNQPTNKHLRVSKDPLENYAVVTKMLGFGRCYVQCLDDVERLCIIRNKFRGRGKRDNLVGVGTWVLVGLREWELNKTEKKQNCDLLEVYSEGEKNKLEKTESVDFKILKKTCSNNDDSGDDDEETIEFVDDKTLTYHKMMETNANKISLSSNKDKTGDKGAAFLEAESDEEINIDDI